MSNIRKVIGWQPNESLSSQVQETNLIVRQGKRYASPIVFLNSRIVSLQLSFNEFRFYHALITYDCFQFVAYFLKG